MEEWLTAYKIPVGQWGKQFFDFLTTWLDWFFDGLSTGISAALEAMIAALLWPPPLVVVALFAALAWLLHRSIAITAGVAARPALHPEPGALAGDDRDAGARHRLGRRGDGDRRAGRHRRGAPRMALQAAAPGPRPDADAADLRLSHPGAGAVRPRPRAGPDHAPSIFAIPAPIRLTHLGITSVPKQLIEAGEAFGATQAAASVEGRAARRPAHRSWRA